MFNLLLAMYLSVASPTEECYFTKATPYIISENEDYIKLRLNVHCSSGYTLYTVSPHNNLTERQLLWADTPTQGRIVEITVTRLEYRSRSVRIIPLW